MDSEPWIDPDGEAASEIIKTIQKCPSGALSYTIEDEEHRDCEGSPAVEISKDGPYHVTGGVELLDVEREEGASQEHYALCRCGASNNKLSVTAAIGRSSLRTNSPTESPSLSGPPS
jgi:hypothetical protein